MTRIFRILIIGLLFPGLPTNLHGMRIIQVESEFRRDAVSCLFNINHEPTPPYKHSLQFLMTVTMKAQNSESG
ncbi:hypothetical protein F5879DRAFT_966663 [Lentinula edodes]|nr:hypothetical protein F5879DRAFT_966663 [Lentinula edodes]